jgi:hypothetical protein
MKLHEDITNYDGIGVIPINAIDKEEIEITIYNYYDQHVQIDIKSADYGEIIIPKLKISTANKIFIEFVSKKYNIFIENLIFYCSSIKYLGKENIKNLQIFTDKEDVTLYSKNAKNIYIEQIEDKEENEKSIRHLIKGFNIIPGSGEFILNGREAIENLRILKSIFPNTEWICPVVSWFADSLDIKDCKIQPGFDPYFKSDKSWNVGVKGIEDAYEILSINDSRGIHANYGGSIDDNSIKEFLRGAKPMGFKILFYPLIMVDRFDKPWRGRISGSFEDIDRFYEEQYKPFI